MVGEHREKITGWLGAKDPWSLKTLPRLGFLGDSLGEAWVVVGPMKYLCLAFLMSLSALAQDVSLTGYRNHLVTDLARKGVTKEKVFKNLDRDFINIHNSICSNRALMWAWDIKRDYHAETAKIFLFYTDKTGEVGKKTWWHHVAPIVAEKGRLWVVDGGFPGEIDGPLSVASWQRKFVGSSQCHRIDSRETELVEEMFKGHTFPATTRYGTFDCYYRIVPAGYWTPASVASNLLGKDKRGRPIHYVRDEIDANELMAACEEATTTPLGRVFTNEKKNCQNYLNWDGRRH